MQQNTSFIIATKSSFVILQKKVHDIFEARRDLRFRKIYRTNAGLSKISTLSYICRLNSLQDNLFLEITEKNTQQLYNLRNLHNN